MLRGLVFLLCCLTALGAAAADRPFPQSTKRGTMSQANHPFIVIDGKTRQLAPGARIWNQDNLIEMPASLRASNFKVNYTEDTQGEIDRVWILTPSEAKEPLSRQTNSPIR
jgi:hypothetical protein